MPLDLLVQRPLPVEEHRWWDRENTLDQRSVVPVDEHGRVAPPPDFGR
jgi:hypothetical protein